MGMLDFNNAPTQRDGEFNLIPDGEIVPVQLTLRPGNAGDGGWLKRSNSGDCLMLDCEFIVFEGEYAKRKFWTYMTVDGQTDGQKKAVEISVARIRALLESARAISSHDESADAQERRKITSYGDLDGMRFWAIVGLEKGTNGYKDKNVLKSVLTPDRSEYRKLDQVSRGNGGNVAASNVASAAKAAASSGKPSWA